MNKKVVAVIAGFLGLYLFATGVSFAVFTFVIPVQSAGPSGQVGTGANDQGDDQESGFKALLDISGPKTEECPLNGELFTENEKESWEKRRPLLVMVENHEEARPQSGLSAADVLYETVAEGGITRFMGVFYCDAQSHEIIIGPVRSARTYFLDWASEYSANPLYAHVGGANCNAETGSGCANGAKADALGQVIKYGWGGPTGNDMNQYSIGYPTYWRDYERIGHPVATEHTMYSTTERLWAIAKDRGWEFEDEDGVAWDEDFVPWTFVKSGDVEAGTTTTIDYNFWDNSPAGDYSVNWTYDPTDELYRRSNAGDKHLDLNTEQQLAVTNLVVMYSDESRANDGYEGNVHLLYDLIGEGEGVLFKKGQAEPITWEKKSRTDRTVFFNEDGDEVEFVAGKIWISNLHTGNESLKY